MPVTGAELISAPKREPNRRNSINFAARMALYLAALMVQIVLGIRQKK